MLWVQHYFLCCLASKSWFSGNKTKFEQKDSCTACHWLLFVTMYVLYYKCLLHVKCCEKQAKHTQIVEETMQNRFSKWNMTCHDNFLSTEAEEYNDTEENNLFADPLHCSDTHSSPGPGGHCAKFSSGTEWKVSSLQSPCSPALCVSKLAMGWSLFACGNCN